MAPKKKLFLKLEKKFPPKMWPLSSQGEGCKALVAGPLKKVFKKNLIVLGGGGDLPRAVLPSALKNILYKGYK